ncbi:BatD family protein [Paracoccus ravus]|uniref:BatD family protein n=1 Tax=Paracoccus ravus TaxID=2447760 RepID=UPI00106E0F97|nr:BatD family protein [Paracoccus ravus]
MVIRLLACLAVLVLAAPAFAQDSLRLILPEARPVIGEIIPLTIRGEYTGWITLEDMEFPDSADYDWIQLGPDDWRDERVGGRQRRIFERRIAVFARKAGTLTLGPVTHVLTKAEGNTRQRVEVTAAEVRLPIQPYPAPGRPLVARSLKVTDELSADPARIRDDQTILRRITLTAEGTMAHLLPARPELRAPWLISFTSPEKRETRLTERGPVGFVQWEWSLRPITGEQGTLPPMRFSWFDTNKRELRGEITQPIPFGYGRLEQNIGGSARPVQATAWSMLAVLAAGGLAGLVAMLWGKRTRPLSVLALGWRRWRPNPHLPALQAAAAQPDLFALRRVAQDFVQAEDAVGRCPPREALATLDHALFGPSPVEFDRSAFLRALTGRQ